MTVHQRDEPSPKPTNGESLIEGLDALATAYGNRFLLEPAPDNALPEHGMRAVDAMRLIGEELILDGIPMRNLATFVTTWMEPEAQRIIAENLHRNFIDHAEYPQTAEIEQRCIRMLANLFHAPGRDDRRAHAGLVGGDHARRAVAEVEVAPAPRAGAARTRAGRTSSSAATCTSCGRSSAATSTSSRGSSRCSPTSTRSGPRTSSRTSTRTRSASPPCSAPRSPGTPTTSSGINDLLVRLRDEQGLDVPLHVDAASGGFVWPFLYPDSAWDFRLEQVRSINVSGHKFGLVYPGIGWLIFRETSDLAEDLVFYENYLGKTDATFTLNFSTGSAMVLAQYYNFVRFGHDGYRYIMETMQANTRRAGRADRRHRATSG